MVQRPSTTPVFILAGGAGERLQPLTQAKPKPAVSFGGTHQILDFTLSNCINSGLRRIFVLTQHHREPLHEYVRENRLKMSQSLRWHEGDELLALPPVSGKRYRGTADAVFQNLPLLRFETAEHVLIASGDHVYSMDYRPLIARHAVSGADLTIAVVRRPVREASAFGVVEVVNGKATRFTEKPSLDTLPQRGDVLVNMGIYVFRRRALLDIADRAHPLETDFGRDIVPKLIHREDVAVYDFGETRKSYWRDVGSLDSYFQANMDLLADYPEVSLEAQADWPVLSLGDSSITRSSDSRISCGARHSIVSRGACIEPGALIEDSVILPGAHVGRNTRVRNAIVAEGASVPSGLSVGLDPKADRSRFVVTEGGVVVVGGSWRRVTERAVYARSTQPAPVAA